MEDSNGIAEERKEESQEAPIVPEKQGTIVLSSDESANSVVLEPMEEEVPGTNGDSGGEFGEESVVAEKDDTAVQGLIGSEGSKEEEDEGVSEPKRKIVQQLRSHFGIIAHVTSHWRPQAFQSGPYLYNIHPQYLLSAFQAIKSNHCKFKMFGHVTDHFRIF